MSDGPCYAGPTRWRDQRASACAGGNRAPWHGAGCSAGTSACPWPRLYLLSVCDPFPRAHVNMSVLEAVAVRTLRWSRLLAPAREPDDPSRSRIATFGRLFEGTDEISLGQTCLLRSDRHPDFVTSFPPVTIETDARQPVLAMLQNCWHPAINLLASAKAISDRDGAGRRSEDGRQPRAHGDSSTVTSPGHAASARESNDTTTGVGYSQTVDNHVDTRSLSIRPTLSGLEGELLR